MTELQFVMRGLRCAPVLMVLTCLATAVVGAAPASFYACGNYVVRVDPVGEWEAVVLHLDGEYRLLPRTIAASGVRFSDEVRTFWMRGTSAMLQTEGKAIATCELVPDDASVSARPDGSLMPVNSYVELDVARFAERIALARPRREEWTSNPLHTVLEAIAGMEARVVRIVIQFDPSEAPTRALVTLVRENLLDDSVYAIWNEVLLELGDAGQWEVSRAREAYLCGRGDPPSAFAAGLCP